MQVLQNKSGVSTAWPMGLVDLAISSGWKDPSLEENTPVQSTALGCPPDFVEVMLPDGSWETPLFFRTPEAWMGKSFWFPKERIHSYWLDNSNWWIQIHPQELKNRNIIIPG